MAARYYKIVEDERRFEYLWPQRSLGAEGKNSMPGYKSIAVFGAESKGCGTQAYPRCGISTKLWSEWLSQYVKEVHI